jgi:hypothetical protein
MNVEEHLRLVLPKIRQSKEDIVRDYPGDPDSPTVIEIWRQEELVATMMCMPDRDLMLFLLKFGIVGMEADAVMYSSEMVLSRHTVNPGTGKPWEGNEKQDILKNHPDYWFDGLVEEATATTVWNRAGEMASCLQTFVINGTEVSWGKEHYSSDTNQIVGPLLDQISMFWHDETLGEQADLIASGERPDFPEMSEGLKAEIEAMTPVERQARQDLAVLSFMKMRLMQLGQQVAIGLHAPQDSERAKIIQARAPFLGIAVNEDPAA